VVGLRVRGQPDEDRRQQRPLAPPGHESGGDEGEVEQLRLGQMRYSGATVPRKSSSAAASARAGEPCRLSSAYARTMASERQRALVTSRPRVPKSFTSGAAAIGYRNAFAK